MHLYLRLVNESGDPIVKQASEAGFHSEAVGLEGGGFPDDLTTPTPQASPGAYKHFIVLL
jgi:hypothetical protein